MSEDDVAKSKVIPWLIKKGFPCFLISDYGRVPVQMGTKLFWTDIVCFLSVNNLRRNYIVLEVKDEDEDDLDQHIPQAEFYAQRLGAPFFGVTNGNEYQWYMSGDSQGNSIALDDFPPLPYKDLLVKPKIIDVNPYALECIRSFESALKVSKEKEGYIYKDTKYHHDAAKTWNKILKNLDSVDRSEIMDALNKHIMWGVYKLNENKIRAYINKNLRKFKKTLSHLNNENIDINVRLDDVLNNSKYKIPQMGLFFISQIFTGVDPKKYTILQEKAIKALRKLGLTDVLSKGDTADQYIYYSEICAELYTYFEENSKNFKFNLAIVHNFLWHYYDVYLKKGEWE